MFLHFLKSNARKYLNTIKISDLKAESMQGKSKITAVVNGKKIKRTVFKDWNGEYIIIKAERFYYYDFEENAGIELD